jgi:hypothetical protein
MRINTILKLHGLKGPRILYPLQEADVKEVEYAYLTADGIAMQDGAGKILWVDTIVTSDGGGVRIYDNTAASGQTLSAAYGAKANDSVVKNYDPPLPYHHGVYVDLTTSVVRICYKPFGRNLRCTVDVRPFDDLICRVTVRKYTYKNLVARVLSKVRTTSPVVSRVTCVRTGILIRKNLVSRVTTLNNSARNLQMSIHVQWIAP